jgi:5-methyltetrahydrofolate--homocysteine methyltransferase
VENILDRLQKGDAIVQDGALGTMLMKRGLVHGEPPEVFNLTKPHILQEIASLYFDAGAEIITANSFGASPLRLQRYSLEKEMEQINQRAIEAVRKAVGDHAYVAASVGPSALLLKPFGNADPEEVFSSFRRQIGTLVSSGVDILCIETMTDLAEAAIAVGAARSVDAKVPIMATVTFIQRPKGFFTLMGASIKDAAQELEKAGANIVGSNCGNGTEQMIAIAREFKQHSRRPLAIQSNAGLPTRGDSGIVYPETPEIMAAGAAEMLNLGVQIIGGCCGTEPEHIRAIRKAVDAYLKDNR